MESWGKAQLQLAHLAVIDREMFHQQGGKPRTSSPIKAVESQEALTIWALVSQFLNSVQDKVNDLLANGEGTLGMVIGSISFACDELLRVEELVVGVSSNLINDCGFQVYKHCAGHMLANACVTEEVISSVLKKSYPSPIVLSLHIWPLGWMPWPRQ